MLQFKMLSKFRFNMPMDYIVPNRCAACERRISVAGLCDTCLSDQALFDVAAWPNLLTRPDIASHFTLPHCDGLFSCTWYQEQIALWHQQYKFGKQIHRLEALKTLLNTQWQRWQTATLAPKFDCIMAIPLSQRRYFIRGYNQTEQLWQSRLKAPQSNAKLVRIRHTKSQATLSKVKRKQNVKQAFAIEGSLKHINVAIVDDVITTGATIDAAAKACLEAGAASVWAMSLALTPKS